MRYCQYAFALVIALALLFNDLQAQERKILSPRDSVSLTLDTSVVSVNYGRPSMRGRKIMGDLVPWNKVWRTGANQATHLRTNFRHDVWGRARPTRHIHALDSPLTGGMEIHPQQTDRSVGHELRRTPGSRQVRRRDKNPPVRGRNVDCCVRSHREGLRRAQVDLGKHHGFCFLREERTHPPDQPTLTPR